MVERVRIVFEAPEYRALLRLAQQELRPLAQQVRLIVREDLARRGLLDGPSADQGQGAANGNG